MQSWDLFMLDDRAFYGAFPLSLEQTTRKQVQDHIVEEICSRQVLQATGIGLICCWLASFPLCLLHASCALATGLDAAAHPMLVQLICIACRYCAMDVQLAAAGLASCAQSHLK